MESPSPNVVFVPSLSCHTTPLALKELMDKFGPVSKVNLALDDHFKVSATVEFIRVEDAAKATTETGIHRIDNVTIHIERQEVTSTLYIGKMAKDVTESDISALVKSLGSETEKVIVLLDPHTKESKGSGFVKFPSREDAKHCLAKFKEIHPEWTVQWARTDTPTAPPPTTAGTTCTIYIGGITKDVNEDMIRMKFGFYGEITSMNLVMKPEDSMQTSWVFLIVTEGSFCFINFSTPEAAAKAVEKEDGSEWLGKTLRVEFPQPVAKRDKRRRDYDPRHAGGYPYDPYAYSYAYPPRTDYYNPYDYPGYDRSAYPAYPGTSTGSYAYGSEKRKAPEVDYHQDYKRRHVESAYPGY